MFLGVLLKEGSHFQLFFETLLENKPKNNIYFCLKILKLDNMLSIRYRMTWSHHAPNVKQHISYWYTLKTGKIAIFCWWQHKFFRFFKKENCSEKTSAFKTYKSSHQEVFSKICVLEILTSHNGLYEIYTKSLRNFWWSPTLLSDS